MNPDGTPDSNTVSLYETSSGDRPVYDLIDGSQGTAGLKITSHCRDLVATCDLIIGGRENCVDLNNECDGITVSAKEYRVNGKYALSAKTCKNVSFIGHITGKPSKWHVNLGSWSDQSRDIQDNTALMLTADTYPIVVWVGNATVPKMDDPAKYKVIGFGRYGSAVRAGVMFLWDMGKRLNLA